MVNEIYFFRPKNHVVVDMGCGDARLSESVMQKVYSIDLVSSVEGVIQSDMAKTPLETKSAHVVVYCLSLMGTNLKDFFIEANRILKLSGLLKIAEVSSRFEDIKLFIDFVQKCGFELVSQDLSHNLFYFLNFKKTHDVNSFNKKIPDYSLKPCLYKKR
jgi:ribosomal RNA-processing protein 8